MDLVARDMFRTSAELPPGRNPLRSGPSTAGRLRARDPQWIRAARELDLPIEPLDAASDLAPFRKRRKYGFQRDGFRRRERAMGEVVV